MIREPFSRITCMPWINPCMTVNIAIVKVIFSSSSLFTRGRMMMLCQLKLYLFIE